MDSKIINLEDYRTPKSKVFTGRDRGERVRLDSNIDLLADENEIIKIIIPDNLYSINPSFFEDCVLFIASNLITKDYDLMDFCHPAIIFLINFDKKNEIELLKTLKNYIFYTNSPNKAAKVLCIHRNTLFYRINKIKDMTGIKLDNATEICKTYLSIKLLEINGILDFLLVWGGMLKS